MSRFQSRSMLIPLLVVLGCASSETPPSGTQVAHAAEGHEPVYGQVTLKGASGDSFALDGARLHFEATGSKDLKGVAVITDGGSFAAATNRQGTLAAGLVPGVYQVWIEPRQSVNGASIPKRYLRKETSKWEVSIPAPLPLTFELEIPAKK